MFGYFRRVKSSLGAMIVGFLMVPGAIVLHGWNEYRTVHRTRGLVEAAELVETISDPNAVDSSREGKLVHLTGLAETDETLEDPEFNVSLPAIHLARRVEMFQWHEKKKSKNNSSSNSKHTATYTYNQTWSSNVANSDRFHRSAGHENPPMRYPNREVMAKHVNVGAYALNKPLKRGMQDWQPMEFRGNDFIESVPESERNQFLMQGNQLYWSSSVPRPNEPQIGDLRIRFEKVEPGTVSLIAQQNGETFSQFHTSNGEPIQRLYMGSLTATEVIGKLTTENTVTAWVLRAVGLALSVIGFSMILKPLSAVASFVPLLGDFTGAVLFLIAALMGVIVSCIVIGLSWIAVRPLLGIALLALSAVAIYVVIRLKKKSHPLDHPMDEPELVDPSMFVQ
ncbi:MAG: TMEM43 family protein [Rubripirellula sp.]